MTLSSIVLTTIILSVLGAQEPLQYSAPRAPQPIIVDGSLDDSSWILAPWTTDFVDIQGPDGRTPELRTRAKLTWDDDFLYVGAEMEEPHLWATLLERDAIIYRDDDFEVFLDPDGTGRDYFEVEVNLHGTVLDLFLDKPYNRGGRAEVGWDLEGLQTQVLNSGTLNEPSDTDTGWTVELAIPWAGLGQLPPEPGDSWRVNFSRVDWPLTVAEGEYRKTEGPSRETPHPESNWVWSPQGAIDMHIPEKWGVVRFVLKPQNSQFN
ncbi:MAG: hypothetical protein DRI24_24060 [Deltaproteobacteria bacterium]|nr:MAG: hypothetical protein DRI24_24060 [Deltaproteobacteria bacterium]